MSRKITNAKAVQRKSRNHNVSQISDTVYTVTSGASGNAYTVTLQPAGGATCTCEWSKYRPSGDKRSGCSHVVSVFNHITEQAGRKAMAWASEDEAKRQHRPAVNIGDGVTLTFRKVA